MILPSQSKELCLHGVQTDMVNWDTIKFLVGVDMLFAITDGQFKYFHAMSLPFMENLLWTLPVEKITSL